MHPNLSTIARRTRWPAFVAGLALVAAVGIAIVSTSASAGPTSKSLHFLLREEQQVIDHPPGGPSNGDLVLVRGDLLDPKTKAPVGTEVGMYVMVDSKNQNRSVADIVFTPNSRAKLASSAQITTQTIFDSVPGPHQIAAITGGTGRYRDARGQVVATERPDGLIDLVIRLGAP